MRSRLAAWTRPAAFATEAAEDARDALRLPPDCEWSARVSARRPPLAGLRVIECSLLGPGAIGMHLADLGAQVIKVEAPGGDYIREMTWPIVEGVSLLHLHVSRGKRSLTLDLRKPEAVAVFRDLARGADVVIEAMRPGALARRGLGFEQLRELNPRTGSPTTPGRGSSARRPTRRASATSPSTPRSASTRGPSSARSRSWPASSARARRARAA
jgi:hypothetical protein